MEKGSTSYGETGWKRRKRGKMTTGAEKLKKIEYRRKESLFPNSYNLASLQWWLITHVRNCFILATLSPLLFSLSMIKFAQDSEKKHKLAATIPNPAAAKQLSYTFIFKCLLFAWMCSMKNVNSSPQMISSAWELLKIPKENCLDSNLFFS